MLGYVGVSEHIDDIDMHADTYVAVLTIPKSPKDPIIRYSVLGS